MGKLYRPNNLFTILRSLATQTGAFDGKHESQILPINVFLWQPYKHSNPEEGHSLCQGGPTFFFPRAKNTSPVWPTDQVTPPSTIFEN
jgi:hypothetical protein